MDVISSKLTQQGTKSRHNKLCQGCKADWTCAKRAPSRGEPPMGWRRIDMGCRCTEKVESIAADGTATTTLHQPYLYRGYLQISCCDLMESGNPCRWFLIRDPTQPVATRPLTIRKDGTWYTYGWDLTKNICELFSADATLATTYSYTPYGAVTAEGNVSQPIQWSSEFYDDELGLVYYNYRHYNSATGRWLHRDMLEEEEDYLLYIYSTNSSVFRFDILGLKIALCFAYDQGNVVGIDTGKDNKHSKQIETKPGSVFSGNGNGKNNVKYQHIRGEGPIPIGEYKIEKQIKHAGHTKSGNWKWYPLSPYVNNKPSTGIDIEDPSNHKTVRRNGFFMHAGSRSDGCVSFESDIEPCWADHLKDPERYPQSKEYDRIVNFIENSTTSAGYRRLYVRETYTECINIIKRIKQTATTNNTRRSSTHRRRTPRRR